MKYNRPHAGAAWGTQAKDWEGGVDYDRLRKGRLARHEVWDAHPELKRAAAQASEPTSMECPICEEDHVVLVTYAFRNALLPVSSVLGMVFSFLLGSNVLIEQVYGWQGVGAYAVSAVLASDYAAVQGFVLMMAVLYVLLNLLVDLLATVIDPRVRFEA